MPRPRFHTLASERQEAILRAALDEFSTHGFTEASLNRIITAASLSKGSMYYYFDSKEDLYVHLLRVQVEQMVARAGPFPVPTAAEPCAYWSAIEDYCLRLVKALDASPQLARLLRDWMSGTGVPALEQAQRDAEQTALPWLAQALAAGQEIGAIRTDIPDALLLAVITAIGRVIDSWVIAEAPNPLDHAAAVHQDSRHGLCIRLVVLWFDLRISRRVGSWPRSSRGIIRYCCWAAPELVDDARDDRAVAACAGAWECPFGR